MLLVATLLVVLSASAYGQYQLTFRDNGKLCTEWVMLVSEEQSFTYRPNSECAGPVGFEQISNYVRLCCQAMATTTSSSIFPTDCGKQKFQPARTRIVGGVQANANSWVRQEHEF